MNVKGARTSALKSIGQFSFPLVPLMASFRTYRSIDSSWRTCLDCSDDEGSEGARDAM